LPIVAMISPSRSARGLHQDAQARGAQEVDAAEVQQHCVPAILGLLHRGGHVRSCEQVHVAGDDDGCDATRLGGNGETDTVPEGLFYTCNIAHVRFLTVKDDPTLPMLAAGAGVPAERTVQTRLP
jgi:hypothetical protein